MIPRALNSPCRGLGQGHCEAALEAGMQPPALCLFPQRETRARGAAEISLCRALHAFRRAAGWSERLGNRPRTWDTRQGALRWGTLESQGPPTRTQLHVFLFHYPLDRDQSSCPAGPAQRTRPPPRRGAAPSTHPPAPGTGRSLPPTRPTGSGGFRGPSRRRTRERSRPGPAPPWPPPPRRKPPPPPQPPAAPS